MKADDEVARGEVAPEAAAAAPETAPGPGGDEVARGEVAPEAADCGVCGGDLPPLMGDVLTGTELTLAQAAARLERGEPLPELTPLQRRLVEEFALQR